MDCIQRLPVRYVCIQYMLLNIMFKVFAYCAVSVKQMGEMKGKNERQVDKQREMKAVCVTQASAWQQSGLCASS